MHPILLSGRRLAAYLATWTLLSGGLAALLRFYGTLTWSGALWLALPAGISFAFVTLASWYPARALPPAATGISRLLTVHAGGAAVSSAIWLAVLTLWVLILDRTRSVPDLYKLYFRQVPLLAGFGLSTYLVTAAAHHLILAFEASREADRRSLELNVLAREAELKALRAQIDPHFLFNALNSIVSLIGSEPKAAREMCIHLGDFLRLSLRMGRKDRIALVEELSLVHGFLEIEKARYGRRLQVEVTAEEEAARSLVPPLLLQPLVENAVRHGIAHRLEGGRVLVSASLDHGILRLAVENERDPEAISTPGEGMGQAIVRRRLTESYPEGAAFDASAEGEWYRVRMSFPAESNPTETMPISFGAPPGMPLPGKNRPTGVSGKES